MRIGVISDTHGLLRPAALAALAGSEVIVHAGDIGSDGVLAALGSVAPVIAVRGNCDMEEWAEALPETATVRLEAALVLVIHDVKLVEREMLAGGVVCVVSGHSHKPGMHTRDGVLYLNPGSAGPRRFRLPVTLARMRVENGAVTAEIVTLEE